MFFQTSSNTNNLVTAMSIDKTGLVALAGTIKIAGGSPADGKVWTATDSNGTGNWETPSGGSSDYEGGAVFNDDHVDVDFRVKSQENAYMLMIDGGNDHMGLGVTADDDSALMIDFPTYVGTAGAQIRYMHIKPAITEAGSGTHGHMSGVEIAPLVITNAGGSTGGAATLRIDGPPTGISPLPGQNHALWVAAGKTFLQGNLAVGAQSMHAGTEGSNILSISNGTAPAGTLDSGATFFCQSGEMKVIDTNGTVTQLSPHDDDGEWVFHSKDDSGKVLLVHMEKMMRRLDEMLGGGFIEEYIED